ncbi:MAG: hypothetical protein LBP75_08655 [Planctomycetota bacterium]|jgi:hypothetical protein|nr:hypothetical protein [Planctomycetota bacterium]
MATLGTMNNAVLTHSDMEKTPFGRKVRVYFERPTAGGFDFAEGDLPSGQFHKTGGFTDGELLQLQRYLKNNSPLIWEYAQKGGGLKCLAS